MSEVVRETRETKIRVELRFDGGPVEIDTSIEFLDHMMATLARYACFGLTVSARGDLRHHIIEDVGIAFGTALAKEASGARVRYGHHVIPMDDALVECTVDIGGRPYYRGPLPSSLYEHWMRSFADHAKTTLHLRVLRGDDRHHIVEAGFKALGVALGEACRPAPALQSTKGEVRLSS